MFGGESQEGWVFQAVWGRDVGRQIQNERWILATVPVALCTDASLCPGGLLDQPLGSGLFRARPQKGWTSAHAPFYLCAQ